MVLDSCASPAGEGLDLDTDLPGTRRKWPREQVHNDGQPQEHGCNGVNHCPALLAYSAISRASAVACVTLIFGKIS